MIEKSPLVSVLMTAYNREQFIAEAIESVLASTYTNFELIIVDDCSKDKTVEIARKYELQDNRVRVYVNEMNLGDYPNRNKAASYAKGKYIMYADSDDKILDNGIKRCVDEMEQFPDCNFGMNYKDYQVRPFVLSSADAIRNHFFKKPFLTIGPGGTIIKRDYFLKIKQYPTKYGPANDMYFNLKAACYSPMVLLPFDFIFYREHDGQEINNEYSYLYNNYRYLNDAISELNLPLKRQQLKWISKKNKRRFTTNIAKYFLKTFDLPKTRAAIRLAGFGIKDFYKGIFHFS